jgi:hypothetical protein
VRRREFIVLVSSAAAVSSLSALTAFHYLTHPAGVPVVNHLSWLMYAATAAKGRGDRQGTLRREAPFPLDLR